MKALGDDTPPMVATTGISPFAVELGTCTLIWYSPVALKPAKEGVTVTSPIRTVTALVRAGAPVRTCPFGIAGSVGPKPVPYSKITSPGLAGVDDPGKSVVGPSNLKSACRAAMYLLEVE